MSYVVLKFDDLNEKNIDCFQKVHDYCKNFNIPVSFGLIGESLMNPSYEYISSLQKMKDEGTELWNHGYYHTESEFSTNSYQLQKESIQLTQMLIEKYFCEPTVTFGSPHNNSTEKTMKILRDSFPEINTCFFMADGTGESKARQLVLRCNYEIETGVVDLEYFQNEYERIKKYPYFVMQGHPSFWKEEDFERFKKVLGILIEDGNQFVTSSQLCKKDISGFDKKYSNMWIKELAAFFNAYDRIVFYGAGEIGREVYRFMSMKGLYPDAFVVSDGHRFFSEICGKPVYEFSEARSILIGGGIIPTVLGKTHNKIFAEDTFKNIDIWKPGDAGTYDEFIDYVRYVVSLDSWQ